MLFDAEWEQITFKSFKTLAKKVPKHNTQYRAVTHTYVQNTHSWSKTNITGRILRGTNNMHRYSATVPVKASIIRTALLVTADEVNSC